MNNDQILRSTRDGFGEGLLEAAKKNEKIVVLSADLDESIRLEAFKKEFPGRFVQVGVAEQNLMGLGMGLALAGKIPFICSFAAFNPGRNLDQLRLAMYSRLNIKIIGAHAGLMTGEDGATHQALEDLTITSSLPNLQVLVPADFSEAKFLSKSLGKSSQAQYLRLGRAKVENIEELMRSLDLIEKDEKIKDLEILKARLLLPGTDLTIVAVGALVQVALHTAKQLKSIGIQAEIIDLHTIKPLDKASIIRSVEKTGAVLIAAEHQVSSGPSAQIAQFLAEEVGISLQKTVVIESMGVENRFGESGTAEALFQKYLLNQKAMLKKIERLLEKKRNLIQAHH